MITLEIIYSQTVHDVQLKTCRNFHYSTPPQDKYVQLTKLKIYTSSNKECGTVLLKTPPDEDFVYLSSIKVYSEFQGNNLARQTVTKLVKNRENPIYIKAESDAIEHIISKYFKIDDLSADTYSNSKVWYRITGVKRNHF